MSTSDVEQKVKDLVAGQKYDEAKELLKSSYSLSEEQAVAFIRKLEQSDKGQSKLLKPGCATKASKGCGCFALLFLIMAAWGTYTMYKQYSDDVQIKGMVVDYFTVETTNADGKLVTYYNPIVIYTFDGKDYRDTLNSQDMEPAYERNTTIELYVDPQQPEWVTEESFWGAIAKYIPLLVFAIISFTGYRVLGKLKIKFNPVDSLTGKIKETAEPHTVGEATGTEPVKEKQPKILKPRTVFGLAFVFLLIAATFMYIDHRAQKRGERIVAGDTVIAMITGEYRDRSKDRTTHYRYNVAYEYRGEAKEYVTTLSFDRYNPGDKVELKINPDDPDEVALNTDEDLYGSGLGFAILLFLGIAGLLFYSGVYMVKKQKNTDDIKD